MKKNILIGFLLLSSLLVVNAQNITFNNVAIGTDAPAFGVKIMANFPEGTGGWARGFTVSNETGTTNFIKFGSFGEIVNGVTSVTRSYIGKEFDDPYMTFLPNGNVGIGTPTPLHKLSVTGGHGDSRILLHSTGGSSDDRQADLMLWASEPDLTYDGVGIGNNVFNNSVGIKRINAARGGSYIRLLNNSMLFNLVSPTGVDKQALSVIGNGNVGIGTTSPSSLLTLKANEYLGWEYTSSGSGTYHTITGGGTNPMTFTVNPFSANDPIFKFNGVNGTKMTILNEGSVGIGTTITGGHKLAVEGSIGAREIKVLASGWSDFVFNENYNLPSLGEVEKHIKEKGHLKDIPNEEEVMKNGIYLGEMNAKLLQKIEELTLYVIEQNKEIETLKKENESFKTLSERFSKIESQLKTTK